MNPAERALMNGRYLLNTDGGVKNNGPRSPGDDPGEAAIGIVLNDPRDRPVTTFNAAIGPETIQGAEYRALITGLEIAREYRITKIRAFVDNQLVVDHIHGCAQVRSDYLAPFHKAVTDLLKKFPDQRVYWVPRERNKEADALVREILYP